HGSAGTQQTERCAPCDSSHGPVSHPPDPESLQADIAAQPIADYASGMAVRPARDFREAKAIELLAFAYALGVAGTLWDWREHLLGPGTQPPHLVIDLGGLLVISALAFSGRIDLCSRTFIGLYVVLVLVVVVVLGPFLRVGLSWSVV